MLLDLGRLHEEGRYQGGGEGLCRIGLLEGQQAAIVEVELILLYVQSPVDHLHEEGLELVHVSQGDAAERSDVLIGVVSVVEHLRGHKHSRQDQPRDKC